MREHKVDNLKAAVLKADWFDPQINPKLADFSRHYGLHVMPCRPNRLEHKGTVERAVTYVRDNALKARRFQSLAEQNRYLLWWEENIADKRIHGTTCQQVAARFAQERAQLQPLPESLFEVSSILRTGALQSLALALSSQQSTTLLMGGSR